MQKFVIALCALLFACEAEAATYWNYDGKDTGQDSWSELNPNYGLCATGSNQSPVAIGTTKQKKLPALKLDYESSTTTLSLDRYSVISKSEKGMTLTDGDQESALTEMLVRSPSEHEVRGVFYPFELQFIHRGRDHQQTIIALFVAIGAYNPAIQPLIDHYPAALKDHPQVTIDWPALLPKTLGYYAYRGSISYPPCTEGINWRVLKTPIEISREQADKLASKTGRNARASQPTMLRTIFESEE